MPATAQAMEQISFCLQMFSCMDAVQTEQLRKMRGIDIPKHNTSFLWA